VFGAVAKADTDIKALIHRSLDAVGRSEDTVLTAFTDGCSGLRHILADAGVTETPILDWFHIGMRLQHLEQIAGGLSADDPGRAAAKAMIVEEVDRLHWRLWNGKAKDARISIDRIRTVMHHFRGEQGQRKSIAPARKLWTALHALDGYLTGQSDWLVNYAERYRAGLLALLSNFGPVVLMDFGPPPVPQPTVPLLDQGTLRGLESQSGFIRAASSGA
jgi:hypothetical protein